MSIPPPSPTPSAAALAFVRDAGWPTDSHVALAGDVSARRYYRLRHGDGSSAILAVYPQALGDACDRFHKLQGLLDTAGVRVPAVLAADCEAGCMLLEDLGADTLYDRRERGWPYLAPRVERAAEDIARIQALDISSIAELNPPLDLDALAAELDNTWRVTLGHHDLQRCGLPASLQHAIGTLLEHIDSSPRAPCHRDYMARNLVPLSTVDDPQRLGVLDFQDLKPGPSAYDLASLLNDSLYAPAELEAPLLTRFLPADATRLDYHRCAAQRALKIVGTFVGFAQLGSHRHLVLVAPTLEGARRHLRVLPELAGTESAADGLLNALAAAAQPA